MIKAKKSKSKTVSRYPRLMMLMDFVVLFHSKNKGMVVMSNDKSEKIGSICNSWNEDVFCDYNGVIKLKNKK